MDDQGDERMAAFNAKDVFPIFLGLILFGTLFEETCHNLYRTFINNAFSFLHFVFNYLDFIDGLVYSYIFYSYHAWMDIILKSTQRAYHNLYLTFLIIAFSQHLRFIFT